MHVFADLHRNLVTLAGALLVSTVCVTAAVGPVKAATPAVVTSTIDAATPAR